MRTTILSVRTCIAALVLLWSQLAVAGGLRFAAEFPEIPNGNARKLSAQRFVLVNVEWGPDTGKTRMPYYQFFDFKERKVVEVPLPLHEFPKAHLQVLGTRAPMAHVVHFDGQVFSLTLNASKNHEAIATYFCQYDTRTNLFSELVYLSPWDDTRHIEDIGFDSTDEYFYFAIGANPAGNVSKNGYTSLELSRIHLRNREIDWTMKVDLPKRARPLKLNSGPQLFSRDGTKLALVEYNDVGIQRDDKPNPPEQVLVVDIPSKTVDAYPSLLTAYGQVFSPDNRYLILGSNELGQMIRIDLEKKKIDLEGPGHKRVDVYIPTPSGKSFLVFSNTKLASPKVVEVRRVSDLKLQTSIPVRMLFPGADAVVSSGVFSGLDGRMLLLPYVDKKGWPDRKGWRLYEVPDDVTSPEIDGGSGGDMKVAQGVVLGKQYADANHILYEDRKEDPNASFSQFVVNKTGDIFLIGTLSENSDGDYKVGRTRPVVAKLGPDGKPKWQRILVKKGFLDYEGGQVAALPDGGCVADVVSYVHPSSHPVTRLVRLDANGKVLWDYHFRGGRQRIGDRYELLPDLSISITGRLYEGGDKYRPWKAVLDKNGKVLSDEVAP